MGIITGGLNLIFLYKVIKKFITPFDKTDAFKQGIIDERGKILKKKSTLKGSKEKDAYTMMDRFVWKLKRLLEKIPFGKSRLASYAAALWFLKEEHNFSKYDNDDKLLEESFMAFLETEWEQDAQFLKEQLEKDMEAKSYTEFSAEYLTEDLNEALAMRKGDKRVVDAFYDQKPIKAHGASILTTDGKTLTKMGMGGQDIAKWENGKIKIVAVSDVKSTEQILRYMKKSIPKFDFKPDDYKRFFEEVEIDERNKGGSITIGYGKNALKDARIKYKMGKNNEFIVAKKDFKNAKEIVSKSFRAYLKARSPMSSTDPDKPTVKAEEVEIKEARRMPKNVSDYVKSAKAQRGIGPRPVLDIKDVDQWTHEIYKGIKAGWKSVSKSTLGGDENVAIMIKVTVEPEKDWPNKILHNAKFGMISIGTDGTMKMFASGYKIKNMRQTKIKTPRDIIQKINTWIKKVDESVVEEIELEEEVFNWYIIKGTSEKGKIAHVGTERQLKLKIRKPTFPSGHVLLKSRKDLKIGDVWKGSYGIKESHEYPSDEYTEYMQNETPGEKVGKFKEWEAAAEKGYVDEVAPPGWEKTVKKMKKHKGIDNPWALAWYMKNQGAKPQAEEVELQEGRPAISPDEEERRIGLQPGDKEKGLLRKRDSDIRWTETSIESYLRKKKVKYTEIISQEVDQRLERGQFIIKLANGIILDYNSSFARDDTLIRGNVKKINKKAIRNYIEKYQPMYARIQDIYGRGSGREYMVHGFHPAVDMVAEEFLGEAAPANKTGGNIEGPELPLRKKKKKVEMSKFAGKDVFMVDSKYFYNARLGKNRYSRYEKYVGNDAVGEAIRQFGRANPDKPIILANREDGSMMYLKYGRNNPSLSGQ